MLQAPDGESCSVRFLILISLDDWAYVSRGKMRSFKLRYDTSNYVARERRVRSCIFRTEPKVIHVDTISGWPDIRVMTKRLKKVTITLDEETARWARVEAARRDTSVSKLLGEVLWAKMRQEANYEAARQTYLSQQPGIHRRQDAPLPSREQLHRGVAD